MPTDRTVCGPNQRCQIEGWAADDAVVVKLREVRAAGGVFMAAPQPLVLEAERAGVEDAQAELPTFGFPRDRFWPQSVAAFLVTGVVLTLLAAQLVAPTRRLRLPRLRRSAAAPVAAVEASAIETGPSSDEVAS
jgi:hypothetical protein